MFVHCASKILLVLYRIYSINRPGRLLNFWTLRVGAYSRWGAYLNKYGMTTVMTHTAFNCFYAF